MVTFNNEKIIDGKKYVEGACLHADTKPTTGIRNGSSLIEIDTSDVYLFNEEGSEWVKQ